MHFWNRREGFLVGVAAEAVVVARTNSFCYFYIKYKRALAPTDSIGSVYSANYLAQKIFDLYTSKK